MAALLAGSAMAQAPPLTRDKAVPNAREGTAPEARGSVVPKSHSTPTAETRGEEPAPSPISVDRIAVIDGDTITVDGREWRLLGFDTPESGEAKCEAEHRAGLFAKRRLTELVLAAQRIEVRFSGQVDRNHRAFGDLLLDGRNVREVMLQEGYARPYSGGRIKAWCAATSRRDLLPEQESKR